MSVLNNTKILQTLCILRTLTLMICHEIERYYNGKQSLHNPFSDSDNSHKSKFHEETLCIQSQSTIRWENFVRGRVSKQFYHVISSYYSLNKVRKTFTTEN